MITSLKLCTEMKSLSKTLRLQMSNLDFKFLNAQMFGKLSKGKANSGVLGLDKVVNESIE